MSVSRKENFKELKSPYLIRYMNSVKEQYGENSCEYLALKNQYDFNILEDTIETENNNKHYEAGVNAELPYGIERLYKRIAVVELTMSCAAHCRYCLRQNYGRFILSSEDMDKIISYLKDKNLEELLITGGDPLLAPKRLAILLDKLIDRVPSIKIFRIATRLFTQNPELINDDVLRVLKYANQRVHIEIATQINHVIEFSADAISAIEKVKKLGITIYSQNVFLKGVNDSVESLTALYHKMRLNHIEPHYLFHSIPLKGTHHFRTSVAKMIDVYSKMCNSGVITGRTKPILALMTDIGKVVVLPHNILAMKDGIVEVRSDYKLEERMRYNPEWKLPSNAYVDSEGLLVIKYVDGVDY